MKPIKAKYHMWGSDGLSLNFVTKEEKEEFDAELEQLYIRHYMKLRARYGKWAANQDGYIPLDAPMNQFDMTRMERYFSDE
jgi:hypothetical protein